MDTEFNEQNENKISDVQVVIDESSPNTKKWKKMVIGVLCVLTLFTVWAGYLIINGSLSLIENPLNINILDDAAILCILWFIGVFIALASKLGILGFGKWSKEDEEGNQRIEPEPEAKLDEKENPGVFRKYILPGFSIFVLIPVLSAVALYYVIYFLLFLFLGVLPYLVGIGMIAGLILSIIRLSKLVYKPKRGQKIMVFSTLMILSYALIIFMMYEFDAKNRNNKPVINQQEIAVPVVNQK
jgi:hypothetical protein